MIFEGQCLKIKSFYLSRWSALQFVPNCDTSVSTSIQAEENSSVRINGIRSNNNAISVSLFGAQLFMAIPTDADPASQFAGVSCTGLSWFGLFRNQYVFDSELESRDFCF